ncbi:MFS transporter [Actinomycetes bacterium KLBMP 9759]
MTESRPSPSRTQLRRAVLSSYLGSVIEYYDFLLYATAAAVVFNQVFFSTLDPLAGTVFSFGTLATGYVARPIGGIVFGHFGDRLGRKKMLITTMSLMGVASIVIGLLPGYATIGIWAPILLTLMRIAQGVAVGGEWAGAVLLSAEHATSRRGLWASFTSAGAPSGLVLSTLVLSAAAGATSPQQFLDWGWRIPFLLSAVLLVAGLVVRATVEEPPVFREVDTTAGPAPIVEVVQRYPRNIALAVGIGLSAFVAQSTLTTFVVTYAVQHGFPRPTVLNALTIASAGAIVGILAFSALSDRLGRRPVVMGGAIVMAGYAFALFPLIDTGSPGMLVLALVLPLAVIHPAMYGPLGALYAELFSTRTRYTGASLAYQIAGVGAGLAPLLFAALFSSTGGTDTLAISGIIAACCLLTVGCTLGTAETRDVDLADEPRPIGPAKAGPPAADLPAG